MILLKFNRVWFLTCGSKVIIKKGNSQTLPHFVETYYVDKQNTLWQGILTPSSIQTGLTHIVKTPPGFKHYFTGLNPESGLNAFFPVLKDKYGTVWGGATNVNKIFGRILLLVKTKKSQSFINN